MAEQLIQGLSLKTVLGDRGYDSDNFRKIIKNPCIPGRKNRKIEIQYDRELYKQRNVVERFFQKIKRYRRISTRYEQTPLSFLGMVHFVSSLIIIRS